MDALRTSISVLASARVRAAWAVGAPLPVNELLDSAAQGSIVDVLVTDAEERWERGLAAPLEYYLEIRPRLADDAGVCRALLMCEAARRTSEPVQAVRDEFLRRFPALRAEVAEVTDLLGVMRGGESAPSPEKLVAGRKLGKYELLEPLGRGGFGEVWRARDHELAREVALKLLAPSAGAASRGTSRLIAEARAAASLENEHIVRVHDAGYFEELGRAYIDSQLAGDPDPAPDNPLRVRAASPLDSRDPALQARPPREIARIMEAACRAISVAHSRGILHRDIKPGNILISPRGRVLVADFGLATAIEPASETGTPDSRPGRVVGTPSYMSPEQARGEWVTPLSDVFSLGATLRFLLTGQPPYQPSAAGSAGAAGPRDEILRLAREGALAPLRLTRPDLPSGLSAIADKAARSEPLDRYPTAAHMADDLRAFLEHRPIAADPRGRLHAGLLWARRHRLPAGIAAAGVLAIGAVGAASLLRVLDERDRAISAEQLAESRRDDSERLRKEADDRRHEAELQRDQALAINRYVSETITAAHRNSEGKPPSLSDALTLAERRLAYSLSERPVLEAVARHLLGSAFLVNGDLDRARSCLERAVEIRTRELGPEAPDTLRSRRALASALIKSGGATEGLAEIRELLPLCERVLGPTDRDTDLCLLELAEQARSEGNEDQAVQYFERGIAGLGATGGEGFFDLQQACGSLGNIYRKRGQREQIVELWRRQLDIARTTFGPDDVRANNVRTNLAFALRGAGQLNEAEGEFRGLLTDSLRTLGENHSGTLFAKVMLAEFILQARKDPEEALEMIHSVLTPHLRETGPLVLRGPASAVEVEALIALGQVDDALRIGERVLSECRSGGASGSVYARKLEELVIRARDLRKKDQ